MKSTKIVLLRPKHEVPASLQARLTALGKVVYSPNREELPWSKLVKLTQNASILGVDPDNLGGFEKAKPMLTKLMEKLPYLKGLALATTSYGWVDLGYCAKRKIPVTNVPGYSRESVAEHALAMLLCLAKRILETDRKTQKNQYQLVMGTELAGKTLGIIGLGSIGSRMAELGLAIGMKAIAYNRTPKKQKGVVMQSFNQVIQNADALSLHIRDTGKLHHLINRKIIKDMKPGIMIVNTADRELVDEKTLAQALKSGKVSGYAYEGEDLVNTPLAKIPTAIGLRGFGWYTKEALQNLMEIWVENIEALAKNKLQNSVI